MTTNKYQGTTMSMNREEAIAELKEAIQNSALLLREMGYRPDDVDWKMVVATQALSILAHEPRKEPPTVDEVGDGELCWHIETPGFPYCAWHQEDGHHIREYWEDGNLWLPLSALPKGVE